MLLLIFSLIEIIKPLLIPVCFITAWIFILSLAVSLGTMVVDVVHRSKTMHQIPCSNCQYFTNDYRLKCSVNPFQANTEEAISCQDYQVKENYS